MNREELFYLLPYVISLALSCGILFYAWQHRRVPGARAYTWFVGGQTLTIAAFIFELISPNLATKLLWDKFQWLTDSFLVFIPFLIFAIQFSEHRLRNPRIVWSLWLAPPILFTVLLATDSLHHLIYPDPHLSTDYPFPELKYSFTIVIYLYALIYVYGLNFYGIFLLFRRGLRSQSTYRVQFLTIGTGFLIPLVLSIFTVADIRIAPQRDLFPFSAAIGNLVVAWGLFRYGLFEIVPIARERVFENINDPVVVLDAINRVVDINQAALIALGQLGNKVIGHPAREVFAKWPVVASELDYLDVEKKEFVIQSGDDTFFYDLNISAIRNNQHQLMGRIIVARDVTRYKTLEAGYRILSEELDQRVKAQTAALRHTAELYRAVVENQTEFIVRWQPDGTRTFVNGAYLRYWGISFEEALTLNLLSHILEEDQPGVEKNTGDLLAGKVDTAINVHRVIKPDGLIGWQEWTTLAIRDTQGKVVEFQSIGRDITARKQAEEALRESEAIYRKAIEVAGAVPYRQSYGNGFTTNYDFIGEGIRDITGYGPEEFNEAVWDSLVQETRLIGEVAKHPWREAIQGVRSGDIPIWQCEQRIRARDGRTRWVYEAAVELRDAGGRSHGSIGMFQDITERKQAEEALRSSEERFSKAFQASPIIITISQINSGKLLEANEAFERVLGYSREEVIGKTAAELGLWVNPGDRERIMQKFLANGMLKNEVLQFQTRNHSIITCDYSAELIELDGEKCLLAVVEDITERKKAESRILHLNRLYVTISQINQTLVHTRDKDMLFKEICRVTIEHGKFRMAWIGIIDENGEEVKPMFFAGEELGYLTNLKLNYRDKVLGSGPTGRAIREGRCIICQDIATDPSMIPWRDPALSRGYRSSAAVPIREQGKVIGALTVYVDELNGFDAENEGLLEQIGQDVSFALDSILADTKRRQAEAILVNQLAFDELMTSLLAKFATCSYAEVDASIEFALQTIAEFLGGDLADLFVLSKDRTSWHSTHKWIGPRIQILENSKSVIVSGKQLTWTEKQLLLGNTIIIKTLDDYPPEASSDRQFSEAEGVISILTISIKGQEQQVFGCIDIVSYSRQIDWSDNDVSRLRLIGDAIANLLERKHAEENLAEAYDTTLEGWARALELRDKETEGHSRRVTETTLAVARAMGFREEELIQVRRGSILHDIGKMGIPDNILRKEGPLTIEEREIVLKHPDTAYNLLKQIPYLEKALEIPYCHHEKWDGSGYPRGLKGEEIPLSARIFAIVDVWDALSSDRPYRKAWDREKVIQYLKNDIGKHFDPRVAEVFLAMVEKGEI